MGGGEEASGIGKFREGWKLEGFVPSCPDGLSDPWVLCLGGKVLF